MTFVSTMSCSVGVTFLLFLSICDSFNLPAECRPSQLQPKSDNLIINNNISPTTSNPTNTPTPSPTAPWDDACCEAIKIQFQYVPNNNNSTCGALHEPIDSCILNQATSKIETINLRNCSLTGGIPMPFGFMSELKTLDLRDNALTGSLPPYFNNFTLFAKLQRFYIANNDFIGLVPFNLFQYRVLKYIDFQQNKHLTFNIPRLNLTDSSALIDKPAIAANFSFLNIHLDNDTDANLYIFFEKLRFSRFSMRSSMNNFSFIWKNQKESKDNNVHTIYATQTFDIFGNNISGEFPCHFASVPIDFYVANNYISDTNVTCYEKFKKQFDTLMLFQRESVYLNQTQCYQNFGGWSANNDHYKYCMFIESELSPPILKNCCTNIVPPTKRPTQEPQNQNIVNTANWFLHNIEWFLLLLIFSFAIVIYTIWKHKKKQTKKIEKRIPRQPKLSTNNDKESLLYGDF